MNSLTIILIGLFLLAVSFFAIGIYFAMRSKQKSPAPSMKPDAESREEFLLQQGIHEVVRLLRDDRNGALLLEKEGVIYRIAADLNPEQRRALTAAAGDLHTWLGLTVSPQEETTPEGHVQPSTRSEMERTPATPLQSRLRAASQRSAESQIKPPSMNPVDVFTRAIASDVPKINLETKSITAQIDDILQEKLIGTPLEKRGIRLLDSADGGVVVFVGIENYDGVDAVPDEQVRRAIRAAVSEWEKRSSQGV